MKGEGDEIRASSTRISASARPMHVETAVSLSHCNLHHSGSQESQVT